MAKAGSKSSTRKRGEQLHRDSRVAKFAAHALREAKLGHMAPLIGYLLAGLPPTVEQREFLAELLERFEGKRGKAELRRVEKELIRQQVKGLIDEEGLKLKVAITEVMKSRGIRSPETIYAALRDSKKRR